MKCVCINASHNSYVSQRITNSASIPVHVLAYTVYLGEVNICIPSVQIAVTVPRETIPTQHGSF